MCTTVSVVYILETRLLILFIYTYNCIYGVYFRDETIQMCTTVSMVYILETRLLILFMCTYITVSMVYILETRLFSSGEVFASEA